MIFNICLLVCFSFFFTGEVSGIDPGGLKFTVEGLVPMLRDYHTLKIMDFKYKIPEIYSSIAVGYMELQNNAIFGLETVNLDLVEVNLLTPKGERRTQNNMTIDLFFGKLGVMGNYNLDIGVFNIVPLYGTGNYSFGVGKLHIFTNVKFTDRNFRNMSIADLNVNIRFREYNESYITGFWNNKEVSDYVTIAINFVSPLIWMLNEFESPCIDCVLSHSAEYIINSVIGAKKIYPNLNCTCIKESWKERLIDILAWGVSFAKEMLGI